MAKTPRAGDLSLYTAYSTSYEPQGQVLIASDPYHEWWSQHVGEPGGMAQDQAHHFCHTPVETCQKSRQSNSKVTHIDKAKVVTTSEARAWAWQWCPEVDLELFGSGQAAWAVCRLASGPAQPRPET
eukprot:1545801-Amphidinium_carterae.1